MNELSSTIETIHLSRRESAVKLVTINTLSLLLKLPYLIGYYFSEKGLQNVLFSGYDFLSKLQKAFFFQYLDKTPLVYETCVLEWSLPRLIQENFDKQKSESTASLYLIVASIYKRRNKTVTEDKSANEKYYFC